jgi:hypothetical protein
MFTQRLFLRLEIVNYKTNTQDKLDYSKKASCHAKTRLYLGSMYRSMAKAAMRFCRRYSVLLFC